MSVTERFSMRDGATGRAFDVGEVSVSTGREAHACRGGWYHPDWEDLLFSFFLSYNGTDFLRKFSRRPSFASSCGTATGMRTSHQRALPSHKLDLVLAYVSFAIRHIRYVRVSALQGCRCRFCCEPRETSLHPPCLDVTSNTVGWFLPALCKRAVI